MKRRLSEPLAREFFSIRECFRFGKLKIRRTTSICTGELNQKNSSPSTLRSKPGPQPSDIVNDTWVSRPYYRRRPTKHFVTKSSGDIDLEKRLFSFENMGCYSQINIYSPARSLKGRKYRLGPFINRGPSKASYRFMPGLIPHSLLSFGASTHWTVQYK